MNDLYEQTAGGATLGQEGPEGGTIVRDESTPRGVRILLEGDPGRSFYSVTCIIPDWLVHPRFFDAEGPAVAALEEMKAPLEALGRTLPEARPPPGHPDTWAAGARLTAFISRFS